MIEYDKKLIPDVPVTPASEMRNISLAMYQALMLHYSDPMYKDQFDASKQALESLSRAMHQIVTKDIADDDINNEQN